MSKTCPHCGTATIAEARFCRTCGQALSDQIKDTPTGPAAADAASSSIETRTQTGELDQDLPGNISFDTIVDRPNFNTVIDRNTYPAPPTFDANATRIDSQSTSYLNPGDPGLTAALTPQPTVNMGEAGTIRLDDKARTAAENQSTPMTEGAATPAIDGVSGETHFGAQTVSSAARVRLSPSAPLPPRTTSTVAGAHSPATVDVVRTPKRGGLRPWHVIVGAGALILLLSGFLVGALLVARRFNQSATTQAPTPVPAPPPPVKNAAQILLDAENLLLSSGDAAGALVLMREAVRLEPANGEAQRRFGDLLLKTGARTEAITAYRAAVTIDPKDAAAWRILAAAEFEEGRYAESANSYRQLLMLQSDAPSEEVQLALGDALRAAGQVDEARMNYEKLALSAAPEIADAARERIAELGDLQVSGTPVPEATRIARNRNNQMLTPAPAPTVPTQSGVAPPTVAPPPSAPPTPEPPRLTAADHYQRGVDLWGSNRGAAVSEFLRAAQSVPDANYYLGLNIAEGRDPKSLGRAQLVSALYYFQVAQRGSHSAEAQRYADQLGKEYDRRRGVTSKE